MSVLVTFLAICLALAGGFLILMRPMWAFVLVMVIFALEQLLQSYFAAFRDHASLFNYIVAVAAALAAGLRILRRDPVLAGLSNPVTYLIGAQLLLWLVAMTYSPAPDAVVVNLMDALPYFVLLIVVTPLLVGDLREIHRSLVGIMVVGSIIAVLIIFNPRSVYYAGRLSLDLGMSMHHGRHGNVLALAEMGGMVALIGGLLAPHTRNPLYAVARIAGLILGLGLAIGSGSRGQVLATLVAGILFYPMARRVNSIRNFFFTSFGLLVLAFMAYFTFTLFIGHQNRERWDILLMIRDIGQRFDMCQRFLEAWIASPQHWLFGMGTNSWIVLSGESTVQGNYVHNVAVEILCEHGLVGAAIFTATTYLVIRAGVRMWRSYLDDPAMRSAAAVLLAICAYSLFNQLKEGSMVSMAPFYLWLVLAKVAKREEMLATDPLSRDLEVPAFDEVDHNLARGYALPS
jgi:hypothetical protein